MLETACKMEDQSAKDYNLWAKECSANTDSGIQYLALQSIESNKGAPAEESE